MLCARNDGDNIIANGDNAGESFTQFIKSNKALLGSKVGEEVTAEAPVGELKFKIISISK